ncbi:MAG: nucleotide exchange factor GrpE [Deltaproteobacteria bacterium]|nr:nucleotide exchange factor GrpE [Deltaproteobacteria bacterium]
MKIVVTLLCLFCICFGSGGGAAKATDAENDGGETSVAKKGQRSSSAPNKSSEKKEPSHLEAGIRMLLVFPEPPAKMPFSEAELNLFRSSLGKSDQLGIVVTNRKLQLLSMTPKDQMTVSSAGILSELKLATVADKEKNAAANVKKKPLDLDETIRSAVAQMSDLQGLLKAVVLVPDRDIDLSRDIKEDTPLQPENGTDSGFDDNESTELSTLSSLLALNNVILYTVFPETVHSPLLEKLTTQSGGKNLFLSNRVSLNDALYTAYDSILLRTIQLAPQTALYDSDSICTPALDDTAKIGATDEQPPAVAASSDLVVGMLFIGLVLSAALLVLLILIWRQRGTTASPAGTPERKNETSEEKGAPSFSKLTIGINRVRNSFSDMESRLHALSVDLDEFGSDNWEMQKKIVSAYAEISKELFLLYDHVSLDDESERSEASQRMMRKIAQALENNGIEKIVPSAGERFHSKYHSHAGERQSDQKAGTILEVVRDGYQRQGFVSDEPFVLRQAEVIVSTGTDADK